MPYNSRRSAFPLAFLPIFLLLTTLALGQHLEPWAAQWITAPKIAQRGENVLHFRKTIELSEAPQHYLVNVSADNQFIFYVNQQRAGTGPSRSDLWHWRYETYDIAPMLHAGTNTLAATVWDFGTDAAIAQMSDRIAFLVHGAGALERIADTDGTWEVEQEKGMRTFRPEVAGYYAAEPGERLDGAIFDWAWQDAHRSTSNWVHAITLGRGAMRDESDAPNNWQLVADPLPASENSEVSSGSVVRASGIETTGTFPGGAFTVPAHVRASVLLDRRELITAYPHLMVEGGRASTVRLTYAEALYDDQGQKGNRNEIAGKHIAGVSDEFLPGGPESDFTPLVWRTWRYLQIDIQTADQPLTLRSLHVMFTAFPFAEQAHFASDDQTLSHIWEVGWRTARLDAHDTYMDTPYWERLQYVGDTRIQALISYVVAGDDRLARPAIDAFNNSRIPEGLTQSRYPSSLTQIIPTFSLLWIGMVHDFWMYRGDPGFVRAQLPGMRSVLNWYLQRIRSDGLLEAIPWWPFVDWGADFDSGVPPQQENGGSAIITLQLVEALRYAAELEDAEGESYYAQKYRGVADRAAQAVYRQCWDSAYGLLADTPDRKHFSQHANVLGVWLDVIPSAQQSSVLSKILSASDAGFQANGPVPAMTTATYYFRFYLARALEHAGMGDDYLKLLGPWQKMLALGLSTWAESPEPTRSDSHAWSSHPNYDLLTIVTGVRPASPGFKTVEIEPHLGELRHVDAALPTPRGSIRVQYTRAGEGIQADVALPEGISGTFLWNGNKLPLHEGPQQFRLQTRPAELAR